MPSPDDKPAPRSSRSSSARKPRPKPSARPARLMITAGAVAAMTVIAAGLVRFPVADDPSTTAGVDPTGVGSADAVQIKRASVGQQDRQKRPVRYVRLKPGQKPPKGAKVIKEAAPTPRIVVRRSGGTSGAASASRRSAPQKRARVVTRTRQSG